MTFLADYRHRLGVFARHLWVECKRRTFVVTMWMLAYAALMAGDLLTSYTPTLTNRAQVCAQRLGIAYTYEDGATERLTAFQNCVEGRSN